ncbi:hypothetical protein FB451DRAFT_1373270 [Mycena latifolia]|nr:hypothetical protein FB451DRAFT_1373270 [Mycena latifolia]
MSSSSNLGVDLLARRPSLSPTTRLNTIVPSRGAEGIHKHGASAPAMHASDAFACFDRADTKRRYRARSAARPSCSGGRVEWVFSQAGDALQLVRGKPARIMVRVRLLTRPRRRAAAAAQRLDRTDSSRLPAPVARQDARAAGHRARAPSQIAGRSRIAPYRGQIAHRVLSRRLRGVRVDRAGRASRGRTARWVHVRARYLAIGLAIGLVAHAARGGCACTFSPSKEGSCPGAGKRSSAGERGACRGCQRHERTALREVAERCAEVRHVGCAPCEVSSIFRGVRRYDAHGCQRITSNAFLRNGGGRGPTRALEDLEASGYFAVGSAWRGWHVIDGQFFRRRSSERLAAIVMDSDTVARTARESLRFEGRANTSVADIDSDHVCTEDKVILVPSPDEQVCISLWRAKLTKDAASELGARGRIGVARLETSRRFRTAKAVELRDAVAWPCKVPEGPMENYWVATARSKSPKRMTRNEPSTMFCGKSIILPPRHVCGEQWMSNCLLSRSQLRGERSPMCWIPMARNCTLEAAKKEPTLTASLPLIFVSWRLSSFWLEAAVVVKKEALSMVLKLVLVYLCVARRNSSSSYLCLRIHPSVSLTIQKINKAQYSEHTAPRTNTRPVDPTYFPARNSVLHAIRFCPFYGAERKKTDDTQSHVDGGDPKRQTRQAGARQVESHEARGSELGLDFAYQLGNMQSARLFDPIGLANEVTMIATPPTLEFSLSLVRSLAFVNGKHPFRDSSEFYQLQFLNEFVALERMGTLRFPG